MLEVFTKARATVGANTTLYYSEFNDGLYATPPYHDTPYLGEKRRERREREGRGGGEGEGEGRIINN
jgi:hypothetical protein